VSVRKVIVVDTETDGLDEDHNRPVEVAWRWWRGAADGVFIPHQTLGEHTQPEALEINRYEERGLGNTDRWDLDYRDTKLMHEMLQGAVLAGANPRFDARMLNHLFTQAGLAPNPWHYRLLDVQAYAAGRVGIPPWSMPGLHTLTELLGVPTPTHGAMDDVAAACNVLDALVPPTRHMQIGEGLVA
jgi:DNA polymerase-3 subunit epsilon